MPHLTVLVVEDEPLIRMALADALLDEGHDVIEASSVLEAVAAFGTHPVDFLITDVDIPGGLNGFDLVRFVRHHDNRVGVIVASGGRRPTDADLEPGETFIPKPYRTRSSPT
ncbi:response regulator [Shinella sumterensis]|uniref:Response regulator n=1 Tax=Shinella sumterensis TaxID=1967501 RepID=A0AA50CQH6_9HYPH|nr:response regulator [Shinella sumterensis]WLS00236.1 response regulator [Shinella sumterensis]